jgi:hypothetical protein
MMNWSDDSILPIQLTHVLSGAAAMFFFYSALVWFVPRSWSFITSLGLAFSYAWWYYSTHLDYTIISHAISCILLYLLVHVLYSESQAEFRWKILALGVINAFALLYLLMGILLIPVILVVLFLRKETRSGIGLYLLSMSLTVILLGGAVWMAAAGTPISWTNLLESLTYSEAFAHGFVLSDIPRSIYGFGKALVTYPLLGDQSPNQLFASSSNIGRAGFLLWHVLLTAIAALPFVILARLYRKLGMHRDLALALVLWFCIQILFGIYWEPSYIKWWTGALIPWWSLMGLLITLTWKESTSLYRSVSVVLYSLVILFFGVNLFSDFSPHSMPDRNGWIQAASILGNETGQNDLFLSLGYHPLDFYLPYFGRRHTLSYELIALTKGSDEARNDISRAIRITRQRGGRVYLYLSNDRNFSEVRDIFAISSMRYELVTFQNLPTSDIVLYQVTELHE